jgi:glycine cleavage system H protein
MTMANNPAELKYTKDHEWARIEGELVRIGITSYAVEQLGDVTLVDLPKPGTKIAAAGHFGDIESVKAVSELFAPVAGEVVAVNEKLANQPELVNDAPYGDGWMIVVRPANRAELEKLLDAAAYDSYLASLQG